LPDFHDLVHVVDPFVFSLLQFLNQLLVELDLKQLQIFLGFELREAAFGLNYLDNFLPGLANKLIKFAPLAAPVVLLDGQREFPWSDCTSAIHKGIVRLLLDDGLVETAKNGFHVHYLEVAFKSYESYGFLLLLSGPLVC